MVYNYTLAFNNLWIGLYTCMCNKLEYSYFFYFQRPFAINYENLKYEVDSKIAKIELNLIDLKTINGSIFLLADLQEFKITAWAKGKRPNGRSFTVYNITINGCDLFRNHLGKTNIVVSTTFAIIRKSIIGLPSKCPLKKVV